MRAPRTSRRCRSGFASSEARHVTGAEILAGLVLIVSRAPKLDPVHSVDGVTRKWIEVVQLHLMARAAALTAGARPTDVDVAAAGFGTDVA